MKSFLLKEGKPIIKWGSLPDNIFFEGKLPEGYSLAVSPSDEYIVVDVDRHGSIDGFDNIPEELKDELSETFRYGTKNKGVHYWFRYSGNRPLANKTSGLGIDLRTNRGYVVWYPERDVRECLDEVNKTSEKMNKWLEKLFSYK